MNLYSAKFISNLYLQKYELDSEKPLYGWNLFAERFRF